MTSQNDFLAVTADVTGTADVWDDAGVAPFDGSDHLPIFGRAGVAKTEGVQRIRQPPSLKGWHGNSVDERLSLLKPCRIWRLGSVISKRSD